MRTKLSRNGAKAQKSISREGAKNFFPADGADLVMQIIADFFCNRLKSQGDFENTFTNRSSIVAMSMNGLIIFFLFSKKKKNKSENQECLFSFSHLPLTSYNIYTPVLIRIFRILDFGQRRYIVRVKLSSDALYEFVL